MYDMTQPTGEATDERTEDGTSDACSCRAVDPEVSTHGGQPEDTPGLITSDRPLDEPLPDDVQRAYGRMLGIGRVETMGEWAAEIRSRVDGDGIDVEDLCHADEETPHRAMLGGETYHFLCFYDAVVLSALAEDPVNIRTESPGGTVIEGRAAGTKELTVTPEGAVFSLGVGDDATAAGEELSPADLYGAVCPYVKAFPDAAAYREWADDAPAATVGIPLSGATAFAAALVG